MFVLPVLLPVTPGTVGPKLVMPILSAGVPALLPLLDTSAWVVSVPPAAVMACIADALTDARVSEVAEPVGAVVVPVVAPVLPRIVIPVAASAPPMVACVPL